MHQGHRQEHREFPPRPAVAAVLGGVLKELADLLQGQGGVGGGQGGAVVEEVEDWGSGGENRLGGERIERQKGER